MHRNKIVTGSINYHTIGFKSISIYHVIVHSYPINLLSETFNACCQNDLEKDDLLKTKEKTLVLFH